MTSRVKVDSPGSMTGCFASTEELACLIRPPTRRIPWASLKGVKLVSTLRDGKGLPFEMAANFALNFAA